MRKVTFGLVVLGVLALAFISMPMRAQNQGFPVSGYPLQFAPSRTSRARPTPAPPPASKFNRAERAIPNEYIVFLNDDTPTANVNTIINSLASAHGGLIKHNYSGFLKAFSVQMPEAAAIALSNDPLVKYVVENGFVTLFDVPWGVKRINQKDPIGIEDPPNGLVSGAVSLPNDGSGVHVYVIDTGTRISHNQFKNADGTSRASYAYDSVDDDNNPNTPSNTDGPGVDNVDCEGHGTLVASILGGNSTVAGEVSMGVAKGVTLHSVRAIYDAVRDTNGNIIGRQCGGTGVKDEALAGMYWVAMNALKPAVANLSFVCRGVQPCVRPRRQGSHRCRSNSSCSVW